MKKSKLIIKRSGNFFFVDIGYRRILNNVFCKSSSCTVIAVKSMINRASKSKLVKSIPMSACWFWEYYNDNNCSLEDYNMHSVQCFSNNLYLYYVYYMHYTHRSLVVVFFNCTNETTHFRQNWLNIQLLFEYWRILTNIMLTVNF